MGLFGYGLIQEKSTRTKRISMKMYRAAIRMLAITDIGSMIPRPGTKQQLPQPHHRAPGCDGSLEVRAHPHGQDRQLSAQAVLGFIAKPPSLRERCCWVAMRRSHGHQPAQVEQGGDRPSQLDRILGRDSGFLWLASCVHLDQDLLPRLDAGDVLREAEGVDGVDELESAGSLFDLVRLKVADQMPGGVSDQLHLWQRFLDSILAEDGQPGL